MDKKINPFYLKHSMITGSINTIILESIGYTKEESILIMKNIYCVYPFIIDVSSKLSNLFMDNSNIECNINKSNLVEYLKILGMKSILKSFGINSLELISDGSLDKLNIIKSSVNNIIQSYLS